METESRRVEPPGRKRRFRLSRQTLMIGVMLAINIVAIGIWAANKPQPPEPHHSNFQAQADAATANCLRTLEDKKQSHAARVQAISDSMVFFEARDSSTTDRLIALLPGDWDEITEFIIGELWQHQARRALPVLEKMKSSKTPRSRQLDEELDTAIEQLRRLDPPR